MNDPALRGGVTLAAKRFAVVERSLRHAKRLQKLAVARREADGILNALTEETGRHDPIVSRSGLAQQREK